MERKQFLRGLGLFGLSAAMIPTLAACGNEDSSASNDSGVIDTGDPSDCVTTPTETEGPFPTHTPSSLVTTDIRGDREGVLLDITIALLNKNDDYNALENAIVDIWHCDADGNYSEYGGTQMQSINYTNVHFLRGRQTSNSAGEVSFTSIFPGWYNGRATHIHVHVYNASGSSLLVTQIAFPEATNSAVVQVNQEYGTGMDGYTYNDDDNVFSDGFTCELCTITGSVANGYALEHIINVSA
ncbi:MAG: intradiol ring-cleavage dioxygenase [Flavobacterium sp.]|uniref:dioxygenase family protein n=1 Tax=Flavobacterium sp. TaxID=239 RepID=UPI00121C4B42|nr:intradiol ring-cleavage dioxygenase [Flavobacterium sp.]RZJ66025.1 MAG: intradiol ring-cleavage dioxygenase [Flavobacterium sp.]